MFTCRVQHTGRDSGVSVAGVSAIHHGGEICRGGGGPGDLFHTDRGLFPLLLRPRATRNPFPVISVIEANPLSSRSLHAPGSPCLSGGGGPSSLIPVSLSLFLSFSASVLGCSGVRFLRDANTGAKVVSFLYQRANGVVGRTQFHVLCYGKRELPCLRPSWTGRWFYCFSPSSLPWRKK